MTMKKTSISFYPLWVSAVSLSLIVLFIYTAASKMLDFGAFIIQMRNQSLPPSFTRILIWTLPEAELTAALLLVFNRTRWAGLYLSAVLMILFTGYITLALLHVFERIPCSCGGVLPRMTWGANLIFNLFFLLLTFTGIYTSYRERRIIRKRN
jgi:putative oxidoreductase